MEAYVVENASILKLDDDNYSQPEVLDAEISFQKESESEPGGRIDVLARYSDNVFAVVELKIEEVNLDTLKQLEYYLTKRSKFNNRVIDPESEQDVDVKWVGIVVGRSISKELAEKLTKGYEFECEGVKIPIAAITINRYRAKESTDIYVVSDTYFKFNASNKDYTKFRFDGVNYNKGALVNAIVAKYVSLHPNITYSELALVFQNNAISSFGIFREESNAIEFNNRNGGRYTRYKTKPSELIKIGDATIATSTNWSLDMIKKFIDVVDKLNIGKITSI